MKTAALYARVSSERQKEEQTIGSQMEALKEYAQANGYTVVPEWIFQDEGYSGAILKRPDLERLRDLAAEGQIETILVYSPDRLSRKYAYQVLLMEEFARHGVETVFIKSPQAATPEEQLLVQFQGMIAEYERAQIAERTRRGKKHRAKGGSVNVLSGAPYGYRYVKKSETSAAYYDIVEEEAAIVREVYRWYTEEALSIGQIYRRLNALGVETRRGKSMWDRSTVWAMLRNPAYQGTACFGKTEHAERKKITRLLRKRGGFSPRCSCSRERPREEWIEIPVPAIIRKDTFSLARERLERNKQFSPRHTKEPTLLQGLLVCSECGYALYRTSTRTSKRKLYYYRCLGSDDYRYPHGRKCTNRPIRQDYLDDVVWKQVMQLFEDPDLIRNEINRRIQEARNSNPARTRKETLVKEIARIKNGIDRLLDAYQEGLMQLPELRGRVHGLRKRNSALTSELQSIESRMVDEEMYLQLVGRIDDFLSRVRQSAESLNVLDRQKILRLVVKEVLVSGDTVTIKHSIPTTTSSFPDPKATPAPSGQTNVPSYLLCGRSQRTTLRRPLIHRRNQPAFHHSGSQKCPDQLQQPLIADPFCDSGHQFVVVNPIEEFLQIQVRHPAIAFDDILLRLFYRLMHRAPGPKPVAMIRKRPVPSVLQDLHHRLLDKSIQHRRDAKLPLPSVRLRDFHPFYQLRLVGPVQQLFPDSWPMLF
jgi:site-specific DNA recombinase